MARTCCPLYTIKCNATDFQLSKSQKKVLKKFRNFLLHDKRPPGSERGPDESGKGEEEDEGMDREVNDELEEKSKKMETALGLTDLPPSEEVKIPSTTNCPTPPSTKAEAPPSPMIVAKEPSRRNPPAPGSGADPSKPQLGKAKAQRRARKLAKQAAAGRIDETPPGGCGKEEGGRSVDAWLGLKWGEVDGDTPAHVFTTRLVPAQDDDDTFRETFQDSLKIYQNYQQVGE